jgi:hypothetical protein
MSNRLRMQFIALAFASTIVVACSGGKSTGTGGGSDCASPNPCPLDPAVTQAEISSCNSYASDTACGAKFIAAGRCSYANAKCGADNKTDKAATDAATKASCAAEVSAYQACKAGGGGVDGGGGGGGDAGGGGNEDAGGGGSCGTITWTTAACTTCMNTKCCAEQQACSGNAGCTAILTCLKGCGSDATCSDDCVASNPGGQATEGTLSQCFNGCATQCQ